MSRLPPLLRLLRPQQWTKNLAAFAGVIFGGRITIYQELCEQSREEAFELMIAHASAMGANAIIGMRYDANEVAAGITEVLAYGTAVVLEEIR